MPKLKFSDGMEIDTGGKYRVIHKSDGYYVTGHGFLCPVDTREQGEQMIAEMLHDEKTANHVDGFDRDDLGESPDY